MPLNLGRLEALMARRGLEDKDIAAKIGVNPHTVYRWTMGTTNPTSLNLSLLADALSTSTDYLLGNTEDPTPPKRKQIDVTDKEHQVILAMRRGELREVMRLIGNDDE